MPDTWTYYGESDQVVTWGNGWVFGYAYTVYFGGPPPFHDPIVHIDVWTQETPDPV
jgi:hypothetical protein